MAREIESQGAFELGVFWQLGNIFLSWNRRVGMDANMVFERLCALELQPFSVSHTIFSFVSVEKPLNLHFRPEWDNKILHRNQYVS